jgi:hypothetical protein
VLEAMVVSILLDHHIRLLELAAEVEKIRAPEREKKPKGIEKFLQPPASDGEACQTTTETTPPQGNS